MKETLVAARWIDLAARLGIVKPLVAFRWLESHYEEFARKYHTPRHIAESLALLDRAHDAEYWWVPTALYRTQRDAILNSFGKRSSIYATHECRERYERQARNNIAWGLEQLNFGRQTFRWTARF